MVPLRSRGYGASLAGALAGQATGFALAAALSYAAYYPLGGASCADIDHACDKPFSYAVLLFLILGLVGLVAGAAVGCHLALRPTGLSARKLTVALMPVLTVAAMALLIGGGMALSPGLPGWTLLIVVPSLLVLVPLTARLLALQARDPDPPAPAGEPGPPRRAWGPERQLP